MKMYAELIGNYKNYRIKSLQDNKLIIDADYYSNPDNDGEIMFQLINLSPFDIQLKAGDRIGQGIIKKYGLVEGDRYDLGAARLGGFGSTNSQISSPDLDNPFQGLKEDAAAPITFYTSPKEANGYDIGL